MPRNLTVEFRQATAERAFDALRRFVEAAIPGGSCLIRLAGAPGAAGASTATAPILSPSGAAVGAIELRLEEDRGLAAAERAVLEAASAMAGLLVERERTARKLQDSEQRLLDFAESTSDRATRDGVAPDAGTAARDTTQQQRTQSELAHARKLEAVGEITGGIAHDLNNLLTVILSYSDLLVETLAAEADTRRMAEQIRRSSLRAAELTRTLLAFSRRASPDAAAPPATSRRSSAGLPPPTR